MDSARNHELFNEFAKLMAENEILAKQNRLFASYLARSEQSGQQEDNQETGYVFVPSTSCRRVVVGLQRGRGRCLPFIFCCSGCLVLCASKKKHKGPKTLNMEQLMGIANEEQTYRTTQLKDLDDRVKSDINLLKAITEATRIRINEMRKVPPPPPSFLGACMIVHPPHGAALSSI